MFGSNQIGKAKITSMKGKEAQRKIHNLKSDQEMGIEAYRIRSSDGVKISIFGY